MSSNSSKIDQFGESHFIRDQLLGQGGHTPSQTHEFTSSPFDQFPEIIGRSSLMLNILETISKVAKASKSSVLILGESGTGKELVASAIHRLSSRASRPFIPINCSAIPEPLLEAELFGHEKGAFTGADKRREGIFASANGGTIFLDEIGDMPTRLQAKLLRVLQEKKFSPVGSNKLETTNVRIIAATNVDLESAVEKGSFRLDLYYRLNVLPIDLPPLRQRGEDVSRLLDHFLVKANIDHQKSQHCYLASEVYEVLKRYSWPGNIRQLQNLIDRLVIIKDGGKISIEDLPKEYIHANAAASLDEQQPELRFVSSSTDGKKRLEAPLKNNDHNHQNAFNFTFAEDDTPAVKNDASSVWHLPIGGSEGSQDFFAVLSQIRLPDSGLDLPKVIESLENQLIVQALDMTSNNKNQAARLLGMNRTTLVERIKKRKITRLLSPTSEL